MGLEYVKLEQVNREHIVLTEKLWLTADRDRIVKDGDPDAAFLLGTPGKKIDRAMAEQVGLVEPKSEAKPEQILPDEEEPVEFYEDMTVERLKELLHERELTVSGTKQELIDRLVENDEARESVEPMKEEEDQDG